VFRLDGRAGERIAFTFRNLALAASRLDTLAFDTAYITGRGPRG